MTHPKLKKKGGFTLLEFALVVLVSTIVSTFALKRWESYREQAELAATRQVVAALRTALQVRTAQLALNGRQEALSGLAADNPMNWLSRKPANYLGEYYAPDPVRLGVAGWVFDPRDKTLVYLRHNAESFSFGTSRLLKFKVEFVGSPEPAPTAAKGINHASLALNQVGG